jgi:hypothetical protein
MLGEGEPQIEELSPFVARALFEKLGLIISLPVGFLLIYFPRMRLRQIDKTPPKIPNNQIHGTQ